MIDEATVDCYNESEQTTGWFTVIEQNLAVPFNASVLGVTVVIERIELNSRDEIVAVCKRGRQRISIPVLDLPLPARLPSGAEWIEAFRCWRGEA